MSRCWHRRLSCLLHGGPSGPDHSVAYLLHGKSQKVEWGGTVAGGVVYIGSQTSDDSAAGKLDAFAARGCGQAVCDREKSFGIIENGLSQPAQKIRLRVPEPRRHHRFRRRDGWPPVGPTGKLCLDDATWLSQSIAALLPARRRRPRGGDAAMLSPGDCRRRRF